MEHMSHIVLEDRLHDCMYQLCMGSVYKYSGKPLEQRWASEITSYGSSTIWGAELDTAGDLYVGIEHLLIKIRGEDGKTVWTRSQELGLYGTPALLVSDDVVHLFTPPRGVATYASDSGKLIERTDEPMKWKETR